MFRSKWNVWRFWPPRILLWVVSRETTPVSHGDVVHLEGRPDGGRWVVDREQGFLVLLPDNLISGTSISSSIRCMRRAVLGDMFKVKVLTRTITSKPVFVNASMPPLDIFASLRMLTGPFYPVLSFCCNTEFWWRLEANAERHHGPWSLSESRYH